MACCARGAAAAAVVAASAVPAGDDREGREEGGRRTAPPAGVGSGSRAGEGRARVGVPVRERVVRSARPALRDVL